MLMYMDILTLPMVYIGWRGDYLYHRYFTSSHDYMKTWYRIQEVEGKGKVI